MVNIEFQPFIESINFPQIEELICALEYAKRRPPLRVSIIGQSSPVTLQPWLVGVGCRRPRCADGGTSVSGDCVQVDRQVHRPVIAVSRSDQPGRRQGGWRCRGAFS